MMYGRVCDLLISRQPVYAKTASR